MTTQAATFPLHGEGGRLHMGSPSGGVGVPPDDSKLEGRFEARPLPSPAPKVPPSFYTCTGDTVLEEGYTDDHGAVQEDRLRKLRKWTGNVAKVRRLEFMRLQRFLAGAENNGIPDLSRGCSSPIELTLIGGNKRELPDAETGELTEYLVDEACSTKLIVKCGRATCRECASNRRRMWAARAFCEISLAERTWFVTLTASPETMQDWFIRASIGLDYSPGIGRELKSFQYDQLVKAAYRDIQLWKKRVARSARGLIFLVTVEKHTGKRAKDAEGRKLGNGDFLGLPHFHIFVHETDAAVTWRDLDKQSDWLGLSEAKLVDKNDRKAAWYICKYISKDNGTRNVWPSFRYGRPDAGRLPDAHGVL